MCMYELDFHYPLFSLSFLCRIRVTMDEERALVGWLECFPSFSFLFLIFFWKRGKEERREELVEMVF